MGSSRPRVARVSCAFHALVLLAAYVDFPSPSLATTGLADTTAPADAPTAAQYGDVGACALPT
ncbi:MAG: hypothetical protein JNL82_27860 [Myxococcales bacterium]|nr:hypothetical protein [Myxococcales bacterium]